MDTFFIFLFTLLTWPISLGVLGVFGGVVIWRYFCTRTAAHYLKWQNHAEIMVRVEVKQ